MPGSSPTAAKPTKSIFDPFNSSATGHQRADSRLAGSTSWRSSRNLKLREQYTSGSGGGKRVSDTVGAGSEDFGKDGRLENGGWARGASGLRTGGQQSIWDSMKVNKNVERPAKKAKLEVSEDLKPTGVVNPFTPFRNQDGTIRETSWTSHEDRQDLEIEPLALKSKVDLGTSICNAGYSNTSAVQKPVPQIFAGLTIYINGSTAPLISDHKLKYLLSTHGAHTSVAFGRRSITHVIVGRTSGAGSCGGGLAGSKIHKEITRVGGKGIKFVTADWIVESVNAGKRLSESRFQGLNLAAKGVSSVASAFTTKTTKAVDDNGVHLEDG
ncbi:hypothetical protein AMS68_004441 [Peltaster fructicola]|uniref:BRCT domain-containing protein n=1 Tax=Peltaster fructicola TaxID=286661 RepID=A0A6H0XW25_9PEZI|nr:hypothetical protein AMS68_004441 [Peltaster fructicola]